MAELPQGGFEPRRRWPLRRFALAWPLAALVVSLIGIAYWEDQQRTAELADIDAAMLQIDADPLALIGKLQRYAPPARDKWAAVQSDAI